MVAGRRRRARFRVAEDAGQEIVEIVRDAAGEQAEALQFLTLEEFAFEPEPFALRSFCAVMSIARPSKNRRTRRPTAGRDRARAPIFPAPCACEAGYSISSGRRSRDGHAADASDAAQVVGMDEVTQMHAAGGKEILRRVTGKRDPSHRSRRRA